MAKRPLSAAEFCLKIAGYSNAFAKSANAAAKMALSKRKLENSRRAEVATHRLKGKQPR